MANIKELKPPPSKSGHTMLECFRRAMKFVRNREVVLCGIVLVSSDGKVHTFRVGPNNVDQQDILLEAVETLHEQIYTNEGTVE